MHASWLSQPIFARQSQVEKVTPRRITESRTFSVINAGNFLSSVIYLVCLQFGVKDNLFVQFRLTGNLALIPKVVATDSKIWLSSSERVWANKNLMFENCWRMYTVETRFSNLLGKRKLVGKIGISKDRRWHEITLDFQDIVL